jgi:hypothetical protein
MTNTTPRACNSTTSVTSLNVLLVDNEGVNTGSYINGPTLGVTGALTVWRHRHRRSIRRS